MYPTLFFSSPKTIMLSLRIYKYMSGLQRRLERIHRWIVGSVIDKCPIWRFSRLKISVSLTQLQYLSSLQIPKLCIIFKDIFQVNHEILEFFNGSVELSNASPISNISASSNTCLIVLNQSKSKSWWFQWIP